MPANMGADNDVPPSSTTCEVKPGVHGAEPVQRTTNVALPNDPANSDTSGKSRDLSLAAPRTIRCQAGLATTDEGPPLPASDASGAPATTPKSNRSLQTFNTDKLNTFCAASVLP